MFRKEFLRVSVCLLTFYLIAFVFCETPMLGPADLNLKHILQCENPEQYSNYFVFERKKVNRTHAVFNGEIKTDIDVDETVRFYFNVAKWGDGGFKPNFIVLNETNACESLFKYIRNDATSVLRAAGRPEKCPVTAGYIPLVNYTVDYRKAPQELVYGDYKVLLLLIKDGVTKLCNEIYAEATPQKLLRDNN